MNTFFKFNKHKKHIYKINHKSTSSDAQRILAGSYFSFLQFVLCNPPTAKTDQQNQISAAKIFHNSKFQKLNQIYLLGSLCGLKIPST